MRSPLALLRDASDRTQVAFFWCVGTACAIALIATRTDATAFGLVFNDMLARLVHGQFDISPSVIQGEAIIHNGRSYAYFGVFCALLRLPLLLTGRIDVDMTKVSMMLAATVSLGARLAAVSQAMKRAEGLSRELRLIILAGVAFGGESIQYLRPMIYQEVCCWGAALAAIFVLLAVRRIFAPDGKRGWSYAAMALVAGLALLCRVSFGLGLYAALGLMLCVEAWSLRSRPLDLRTLAPAAVILILFVGLACGVNAARWGRPLTFVPVREQIHMQRVAPDRVDRLERYGELNLERAPFALQYYFAPIWVLQDRKGDMLFQQTQVALFDSAELPPSSLFLSDPVVCLLAAFGLWALARRPDRIPRAAQGAAGVLGLACPALVMLLSISVTFRYRMEFYPVLNFAACLGAAALRPEPARVPNRLFLYLAALGMAVSLFSAMLYADAPLGPAADLDMRGGWLTPIREARQGRDPHIGHLLPDGRRLPAAAGRKP